jgi:hypothetical protein
MGYSKNDVTKIVPPQLLRQCDKKSQTNVITIINTMNAIIFSRLPLFFTVALRVFWDETISVKLRALQIS